MHSNTDTSGYDVVYTRNGHVSLRNVGHGAALSAAHTFGQNRPPCDFMVYPTGTYKHPTPDEAAEAYKRGYSREPFTAPADDASPAEWQGYHAGVRDHRGRAWTYRPA